MKRYTIKSYGIDDWDEVEKDNGSYVKFTDHQAEIAKLLKLLERCYPAIDHIDYPELYRDVWTAINDLAQKDSTQ